MPTVTSIYIVRTSNKGSDLASNSSRDKYTGNCAKHQSKPSSPTALGRNLTNSKCSTTKYCNTSNSTNHANSIS